MQIAPQPQNGGDLISRMFSYLHNKADNSGYKEDASRFGGSTARDAYN
jgi:hypothetical protein